MPRGYIWCSRRPCHTSVLRHLLAWVLRLIHIADLAHLHRSLSSGRVWPRWLDLGGMLGRVPRGVLLHGRRHQRGVHALPGRYLRIVCRPHFGRVLRPLLAGHLLHGRRRGVLALPSGHLWQRVWADECHVFGPVSRGHLRPVHRPVVPGLLGDVCSGLLLHGRCDLVGLHALPGGHLRVGSRPQLVRMLRPLPCRRLLGGRRVDPGMHAVPGGHLRVHHRADDCGLLGHVRCGFVRLVHRRQNVCVHRAVSSWLLLHGRRHVVDVHTVSRGHIRLYLGAYNRSMLWLLPRGHLRRYRRRALVDVHGALCAGLLWQHVRFDDFFVLRPVPPRLLLNRRRFDGCLHALSPWDVRVRIRPDVGHVLGAVLGWVLRLHWGRDFRHLQRPVCPGRLLNRQRHDCSVHALPTGHVRLYCGRNNGGLFGPVLTRNLRLVGRPDLAGLQRTVCTGRLLNRGRH